MSRLTITISDVRYRALKEVLDYGDYRNFEGVIEKAKLSCFNSGHRIEDHFVDVTEMIEIGKGGRDKVTLTLIPSNSLAMGAAVGRSFSAPNNGRDHQRRRDESAPYDDGVGHRCWSRS